ncbi:hypothetical protein HDU67_000586 [Dinochytrium kinnereticum]|nr:hypothetical protein HDU67_000586 [Dinochytrium kinnereticum]
MGKQLVFSGSKWEPKVAYARAVRQGPFIAVSGTTSTDWETGEILHRDDAYLQAKHIFKNIERALKEVNASFSDVIRTRMFVVDMKANWEAVGRAHKETFEGIFPAATMVEAALIDPSLLVEIEVDAFTTAPL